MQSRKYPGHKGRPVTVEIGENVRVSKSATFGPGVVLHDGVVIGPQSKIGAGCKLWQTSVGRQCVIGERAEISRCTIGDKVTVGARFSFRGRYHQGDEANSIATGVIIGDSVRVEGAVAIDEGVRIADGTKIEFPWMWGDSFAIGRRTHIGSWCVIRAFKLDAIAQIGDNVTLDAAHIALGVVIGAGATVCGHIGSSTTIGPNSEIGRDVQVGAWCQIGSDVTIRRTVVVPNHWEIPDSTIVNPGPDSIPVVIHKTVTPRV